MSAEDAMDKITFDSIMPDSDIQPYFIFLYIYLFRPEYMAEEMQQASENCTQCILVHVGTASMFPQAVELCFLCLYVTQ